MSAFVGEKNFEAYLSLMLLVSVVQSVCCFAKWSLWFRFPNKMLYAFSVSPTFRPARLLDFITLIELDEE
jgi:hypothetical protein